MKEIKIGLCKGRHEMPVSEFLYPQTIADPTNTESLELAASEFYRQSDEAGVEKVSVYVTGLTVALTSLIRVASWYGWTHLSLYHYDAVSGSYYEQAMW